MALAQMRPQPDVPGLPRVRLRARHRRDARAPRRDRGAGCSNGKRRRPRRRGPPDSSGSEASAASPPRWWRARSPRRRLPSRSSRGGPGCAAAAAPFLLLWAVAPDVAYWLSVPARRPRAAARRDASGAAAQDRAQDLALLRDLRDRGRRAGCRRTTTRRTATTPSWRAGPRRPTSAMSLLSTLAAHDLGYLTTDALARASRPHAHDARRPRAPPRAFPELVRHGDAGAAAPALRLDRRQRQPRRGADRAGAGPARADARSRRRAPSARRAGRHRRSARRGVVVAARTPSRARGARPRSTGSRARSSTAGAPRAIRRVRSRLRGAGHASSRAWPRADARAASPATTAGDIASGVGARARRRRRASTDRADAGGACDALARRATLLADEMRFDFLYDRAPAHLLDRLPARRRRRPGTARRLLLRPARLGGAARQLRRDRQGRRARSTTGSTSDASSPTSTAARR